MVGEGDLEAALEAAPEAALVVALVGDQVAALMAVPVAPGRVTFRPSADRARAREGDPVVVTTSEPTVDRPPPGPANRLPSATRRISAIPVP